MAFEVLRLAAAQMGKKYENSLGGSFQIESSMLSGKAITLETFTIDLDLIRKKKKRGDFVDSKNYFDSRNEFFIMELDVLKRNIERLVEVEGELEGTRKGDSISAADRAEEISQLYAIREVLVSRRRSSNYENIVDDSLAEPPLRSLDKQEVIATIEKAAQSARRERFYEAVPMIRLKDRQVHLKFQYRIAIPENQSKNR